MIVVRQGDLIMMRQRAASNRRMADFWELPHPADLPDLADVALIGEFHHSIVNHRYLATVFTGVASLQPAMAWLAPDGNGTFPITTMTRKALRIFATTLGKQPV
jgi:hypothetical protein